jgi:hypothetical protein
MLAYRLDKQIPAEQIIQDIQKLVSTRTNEHDSLVLVITLNKITNTSNTLIPKIELNDCPT